MRYSVSAVLATTVLAILGYSGLRAPQGPEVKLAYVNALEIRAQAPGAAEAEATFEREMARWRTEVQLLADSLQQMVTTYEQQQVMLSPEAREQRQNEMQQKRLEFQQRTADLERVAQRRQVELLQPINDKISTILWQIRDEQQYTMIFDVAALVVADTALDITNQVIERLKAQAGSQGDTGN